MLTNAVDLAIIIYIATLHVMFMPLFVFILEPVQYKLIMNENFYINKCFKTTACVKRSETPLDSK